MASQAALKKQQGKTSPRAFVDIQRWLTAPLELQNTYGNYKSVLQTLASKIGDIEQEAEEHKYALKSSGVFSLAFWSACRFKDVLQVQPHCIRRFCPLSHLYIHPFV
jgi:hypothetical protein